MRKIKDLIYRMEELQMVKTCCITGHRDMSEEQTEKIRSVLKEKIIKNSIYIFSVTVQYIKSFEYLLNKLFIKIYLDFKYAILIQNKFL